MSLLLVYLILIVAGTFVSYGVGYVTETAFSPAASLLVFLTMYFLSLGLSWFIAVRLTAPKARPV